MKVSKGVSAGIVVLCLLLAACSGSSGDVAVEPAATPTATVEPTVAPTEVPTVAPTATPIPTPQVSDQERVDAVVAAMDAAIAAGEAPNGSIAYDLLDTAVSETGDVTLNICEWTGDTVHDEVRDSLWRTSVDADGTINATHITTPLAGGDCINTHMIETALAAANEFNSFWNEVAADPTVWQDDPRQELLTPDYRVFLGDGVTEFIEDDIFYIVKEEGFKLTDVVAPILWRTASSPSGIDLIEFVFCTEMNPNHGKYRAGVLLDDERSPEDPGLHAIDALQLVPDRAAPLAWRVGGGDDLVWSDCLSVDDWPAAASRWRSANPDFTELEQ